MNDPASSRSGECDTMQRVTVSMAFIVVLGGTVFVKGKDLTHEKMACAGLAMFSCMAGLEDHMMSPDLGWDIRGRII